MKRRRPLAVWLAAMATGACAVVGTPVPAEAAGAFHFQCDMIYLSPGAGSAECRGRATGGGTGPVCTPDCPFDIVIGSYSELCAPTAPPEVGDYKGTMYIGSTFASHVAIHRAGTAFLMVGDASSWGTGAWLTLPPMPTCEAPGWAHARLEGTVFVT
jgi:hypothetical protein